MLRDLTALHIFHAPDEPVAGEPPVTEPIEGEVIETEPEFTLPEDFADQVKSWDVPVDELAQAVALHKALKTEDGVVEQFIATGQSLGFGVRELQRLFAGEPVTPAAPAAPAVPVPDPILGDDPERLLTAAEVKKIMDDQRAEFDGRFTQSEEARQKEAFEARQKQTFGAIDTWFEGKDIKDGETRRFIASLGEKTIPKGADSYDPAVVTAALERGYAEYEAFVERAAQAHITKKGGTALAQPTHLGGGTAGSEPEEETDYAALRQGALNAAKEKVRKRLRDSGEL